MSLRWTVERGLLAGLTLIFNVADHILAAAFHRYPEKYAEIMDRSLNAVTPLVKGRTAASSACSHAPA